MNKPMHFQEKGKALVGFYLQPASLAVLVNEMKQRLANARNQAFLFAVTFERTKHTTKEMNIRSTMHHS